MKKFALIGGIGPESTIEYYSQIVKRYKELTKSNKYPDFLIKTVDMSEILTFMSVKDYRGLITFLKEKIAEVGQVDFSAIASNTPHIVFDELSKEVSVPLISIVEETCKEIQAKNIKKVGLLGTYSTMSSGFYQEKAESYGITMVTPPEIEMQYVHDKYINELLFRDIKSSTKKELLHIVNGLCKRESIEALVLGGTELPLILSEDDFKDIIVLDTTKIHVEAIVNNMLTE